MGDDLRARMSCPTCSSQHVPFAGDGKAKCGECGAALRYVHGRFMLDGPSTYSELEILAFNHGYECGYDKGRIDGL